MAITADTIKELREQTSCGVIECKKALEEAKGDFDKAKELLRKRGLEIAAKKVNRAAKEGKIISYIHPGDKLGVLLEINCETDFVSRSDDFIRFSKDVALQIAAASPKFVKRDNIPSEDLSKQPNKEEYIKGVCLMEQPFIKDPSITLQDCLNDLVAKVGENIVINRFIRYKINETE